MSLNPKEPTLKDQRAQLNEELKLIESNLTSFSHDGAGPDLLASGLQDLEMRTDLYLQTFLAKIEAAEQIVLGSLLSPAGKCNALKEKLGIDTVDVLTSLLTSEKDRWKRYRLSQMFEKIAVNANEASKVLFTLHSAIKMEDVSNVRGTMLTSFFMVACKWKDELDLAEHNVIPTLTESVTDPDYDVSEPAAVGLGKLSDAAVPALGVLVETLNRKNFYYGTRMACANSIAKIGVFSEEVKSALLFALESTGPGKDAVIYSAISALGNSGDVSIIPRLEKIRNDLDAIRGMAIHEAVAKLKSIKADSNEAGGK